MKAYEPMQVKEEVEIVCHSNAVSVKVVRIQNTKLQEKVASGNLYAGGSTSTKSTFQILEEFISLKTKLLKVIFYLNKKHFHSSLQPAIQV